MDIVFTIFFMLCLVAFTILIIDYQVFHQKAKMIKKGMTGMDVQNITGLKVIITSVNKEDNIYYARVSSLLTIFNCRLMFLNGRLIEVKKGR